METKRIDFVDLAKGFCILLVVLFHLEIIFDTHIKIMETARCFRMPLYFILSGLFFKDYGGFKFFLIKKTNKLAIPYVFFFITNIILFPYARYLTLPSQYEKPILGFDYFFCFYFEKSNEGPNAIWFLLCLFILNLIFFILFAISKRISVFSRERNSSLWFISALIILSLFLGYIGYHLGTHRIKLNMYLDSALTVIPFFCFGFLLRKYTNVLYPNRFDKYNFLFIIISFVLIFYLGHGISYRKNVYDVSIFSLYFSGIAGSLAILFIAKYIKKMPVISYIGRYSIITLCTHEIIISLMKVLFYFLNIDISNTTRLIVSFFIIIILETTVVIPFMIKYMPYVTAQKDILKFEQ